MKNNLACVKTFSAYPGEYSPMPWSEGLLKELSLTASASGPKPLVNLDEYDDYYKIEVLIPGASRDDIFLHVKNSVLSIIVLHMACEKHLRQLHIHEFDTRCFERHILLPENADTEFVSAEYRHGTLTLHISKTLKPSTLNDQQIIVY